MARSSLSFSNCDATVSISVICIGVKSPSLVSAIIKSEGTSISINPVALSTLTLPAARVSLAFVRNKTAVAIRVSKYSPLPWYLETPSAPKTLSVDNTPSSTWEVMNFDNGPDVVENLAIGMKKPDFGFTNPICTSPDLLSMISCSKSEYTVLSLLL